MKLKNINEVNSFREVIKSCVGDVIIKSPEGDVFNMKSAMSEYIALGRLLSEQGDNLEIFARNHEDEACIMKFLIDLDNHKFDWGSESVEWKFKNFKSLWILFFFE